MEARLSDVIHLPVLRRDLNGIGRTKYMFLVSWDVVLYVFKHNGVFFYNSPFLRNDIKRKVIFTLISDNKLTTLRISSWNQCFFGFMIFPQESLNIPVGILYICNFSCSFCTIHRINLCYWYIICKKGYSSANVNCSKVIYMENNSLHEFRDIFTNSQFMVTLWSDL